nr:hypothetical protein [Deltaproteobacteria bacterium]
RLPPALVKQLEVEEQKATSERTRAGFWGYASLFAFLLIVPFVEIKNWWMVIAFYAVVTFMCVLLWVSGKTGRFSIGLGIAGNFLLALVWTRIAGIFILTPVLACGVVLGLTTTRWMATRPWAVLLWTCAAFLVPAGLEVAGVFEKSWEVTRSAIFSQSEMLEISSGVGAFLLFFANIVFVTIVGLVAGRMHSTAKDAKRVVQIQKWHMNHLLPDNPRL